MQILNPQSALLTNPEVLTHIRREEAEYSGTDQTGRKRKKPAGLNATLRDVSSYLTQPSQPNHTTTTTSTGHTGPYKLISALKTRFPKITKVEYLQLYNLRPKNLAELEVIIEEGDERFGEGELDEILAVVAGLDPGDGEMETE